MTEMTNSSKKLVWKDSKAVYGSRTSGYLGPFRVGEVYYDALITKGQTNSWAVTSELPGAKPKVKHYATEEKAKDMLQQVVNYWFKSIDQETPS